MTGRLSVAALPSETAVRQPLRLLGKPLSLTLFRRKSTAKIRDMQILDGKKHIL
jgi:hypothetical protein